MMKFSEVREGDVLIADGGFTCIQTGSPLAVKADEDGLYFSCASGKHYLDGQEDENGDLIGLKPVGGP